MITHVSGCRAAYGERCQCGGRDSHAHPVDLELAGRFMQAIIDERHRAHEKHSATSMEQQGTLAHKRASILTEEAVECGRALNDHDHGDIHLFGDYGIDSEELRSTVDADTLDNELIQTAAMAYTWWANRRGDRLPAPSTPVEKSVDEQIAEDLLLYGCAFEQRVGDVRRRLDPTTITMTGMLQGGEPYLVRKAAELRTMPPLDLL